MITGHLGVLGAARSVSRAPSSSIALIALVLASFAPDILDAAYSVAGFCSPYGLYSHTVPAVAIETAIVAGVALLVTRSWATTLLFALVVVLHIPADFLTGRKLLWPGGEMTGLYWYDRPLDDFLLEAPTVLFGWWLLRRSGRAPQWATSVPVLTLVLLAQTAFDVEAARTGRGMKPSACFTDSHGMSTARRGGGS